MLLCASISALFLLVAITVVILRAQHYVRIHPEIMTNTTPLAYQRCHLTLGRVIQRYKQIQDEVDSHTMLGWNAPDGRLYTISGTGVRQRRDISSDQDLYFLPWDDIGGVGVRMQPGFKFVDMNGDGSAERQVTARYSFHLLIVPITGSTIDLVIPTDDREDAVNFVAHILALAEHKRKRINVFGFDKPPAPHRRRVSRV